MPDVSDSRVEERIPVRGLRRQGGAPVAPGDFLNCVAVGSKTAWAGTGTLITPDVVLTAGFMDQAGDRVFFGHDLFRPGKIFSVRKRIRHPQYRTTLHNDLMLLVLARPVDAIRPCRVAPAGLVDRASSATVVGFGSSTDTGEDFGVKRSVDVLIMSPSCNGTVDGRPEREVFGCDPGFELVAGDPVRRRDSGTGDGGGPLYIPGPDGELLLAGVTSRSIASARSSSGDGGIYVRVDRYREWIESTIGVSLR
jgi:endonuclease G